MQIEIREAAQFTDGERAALRQLSHAVHPPRPKNAPKSEGEKIEWTDSTWFVLLRNDQQLVSSIGMVTRDGLCDKVPYRIGGVGGVMTHPDARRQGYAATGLRHAADYLRDELTVDFSLLVCRDELIPYYGSLGWQLFDGEMLVDQPTGKTVFTFNKPMLMAGTKPVPTCRVIDLCGKPW